jgi:hypothetical protein
MSMREWLRGFALWIVTGFRAAPGLTTASVVFGLVEGVIAPLQAYALKLVVDGMTEHHRGSLTHGIVILATTFTVNYILISIDAPIVGTVVDKAWNYLHTDLVRITSGIPSIVHHERSEVADKVELLHRDARQMSFNVMQLLFMVIVCVNMTAIVTLLISVDPKLLFLLVIGAVRIVTGFIDSRLRWGAARATAKDTRLARSLQDLTKAPHNAVEMRVFGLRPVILRRIDDVLGRVESTRVRATCSAPPMPARSPTSRCRPGTDTSRRAGSRWLSCWAAGSSRPPAASPRRPGRPARPFACSASIRGCGSTRPANRGRTRPPRPRTGSAGESRCTTSDSATPARNRPYSPTSISNSRPARPLRWSARTARGNRRW